MLELVGRGASTAEQARQTLLKLTQLFSEKSGCCPDCEIAISSYAKAIVHHKEEVRRFDDANTYPYLVSRSTIHSWDCYQLANQLPDRPGPSLQDYGDKQRPGDGGRELARLTPDEAESWINQRTGKRGGRNWRRCKSCQPALPGAWSSESNDVPV